LSNTRVTNISHTQIHSPYNGSLQTHNNEIVIDNINEAHSMRHHPSAMSHMVFIGRHECYSLCNQQLPLVLFPHLSHPCCSCLPLLHQHAIEFWILPLINPLHILNQLWRVGSHVHVESMGIGLGATCIMRRGTVDIFCIGKLWGGQDHMFQFHGGLVNYEAHYDLSWFRPLLEGNSPTSSGLILMMNMWQGVSREFKEFVWWKGGIYLIPTV
jgi:hypothetical protein